MSKCPSEHVHGRPPGRPEVGLVTGSLRPVAAPFVAAAPGGARVRTRLRPSPGDEAGLRAVGAHPGALAGGGPAAPGAEGRLDARGRARSRAARKRALTAGSSSRWAGAITRTSEDQVRLAGQNLRVHRANLRARIGRIQARLAVPAGGTSGRVRGYATAAERHAKAVRLQSLQARLARVERQLETRTVSVGPGGGAVGLGRAVLDRRRRSRQSVRERDDPLAPRGGLAGDQAARPARPSG